MGKEREIICVLFFPFQIPIYFEFLVLTRYEFYNSHKPPFLPLKVVMRK